MVDLFPTQIVWHLAPKMSNDHYGDYIKQLDGALETVWHDTLCIHIASDASAPTKGALQALLVALVFQGGTRIANIVVAGGHAMAPNAELMVLEMSIATTLAVGCSTLVCFMDSIVAMNTLVDPSPHSGQGSSLAACMALWNWFSGDQHRILHLWHVPSKEEWKIHHDTQILLCPSCRTSFDFAWAAKEVEYQKEWHKAFADPGNWGRGFLKLVGLNRKPLKPMSMKGGA